jgi:hypothetical protein
MGMLYPKQHKCTDVWASIEESEFTHACVLTKNWIVVDGNLNEDAVLYETKSWASQAEKRSEALKT